jgi:hypothetical protein
MADQFQRSRVFEYLDVVDLTEMREEGPQDMLARRGVDVENPIFGVGGLACEVVFCVCAEGIEVDTEGVE